MSSERIAKVIARAGLASRRRAEQMILSGRVAVNGTVISSPALNVTAADAVTVDDQALPRREQIRLWRLHKPTGIVTTSRDEKGRRTVIDILPDHLPRVMTVGRLDLNSEGLLLLTNDGGMQRWLEHPGTGWSRRYRARVRGTASERALQQLREGIEADGERLGPMTAVLDRQLNSNAWITVELRSGKNREVRRALEAVGLVVSRLIRVSFGPFVLGNLSPGQLQEVKPGTLRRQLPGFPQFGSSGQG